MPRHNEKGEIVGLIGITRDITRRMQLRRLAEERTGMQKKIRAMEEMNKIKSEFVSIVSHELRTPLAIIKEAVGLVFDEITGPISDKQKEVLLKAKDNVGRLSNIIEELLDISRIESGRFRLHYSLVDFNDLLKDSQDFFKRLAEAKGIEIEYSLPKKHLNLFIDVGRINQVLTNLISNAIKFTEQDGKIKIEVKILENKIRIGIIDTGIGIAKKSLSRLFGKFIQVSGVAGIERKGVGLGLSIAQELVQRHGGEIWAESKLGVGSKFYFTLPRFYSTEVLERHIKDRINKLLDKGIPVHLINLLIVNFKEFKKRVKISPKKLFEDLDFIIENVLKQFPQTDHRKPEIALCNRRDGEYSILFPQTKEKEIAKVSNLLKHRIKTYFLNNKVENAFIDLGILPYPLKAHPHLTEHLPANIKIKRIYIGSEIRRFRRVSYKADIEILLPGDKIEPMQSVDISEGGICLVAKRRLATDAKVEIKLRLPNTKTSIHTKARVAWIKNIEASSKKQTNEYKVGLEFVRLKSVDKLKLSKFIKSISA